MENFIFQVETSIKAISFQIKGKGMERCFGLTVPSIKESGREEFRMEKGKYIWQEDRY